MDEVNTGLPPTDSGPAGVGSAGPRSALAADGDLGSGAAASPASGPGDDPVVITRDLDAIETAVTRLTTAIEHLDRDARPT